MGGGLGGDLGGDLGEGELGEDLGEGEFGEEDLAAEEPEAPAAEADEDPGRAMDVIRDEDGDVESVTLAIRRINRSPYGKITVYFRNGQVWRQVDSDEVRISRINPPRTATIRRAAFGSYLMRLNNEGRAIRVRREE